MTNHLSVFDKILYGTERPWLGANTIDASYTSKISTIKLYKWNNPPLYDLKFERPFDRKSKYFKLFIENEKIKAINNLIEYIGEEDTPQLIKYRLNDTLHKKLKTRIQDLGKLIEEQDFNIDHINPNKSPQRLSSELRSNTYVIQLLKLSFIHIYLEIQNVFSNWVSDIFEIEDFYIQLLCEAIPDTLYLSEALPVEQPQTPQKSNLTTTFETLCLCPVSVSALEPSKP